MKRLADMADSRIAGDRHGASYRPFRLGPFGCDLIFDTLT